MACLCIMIFKGKKNDGLCRDGEMNLLSGCDDDVSDRRFLGGLSGESRRELLEKGDLKT